MLLCVKKCYTRTRIGRFTLFWLLFFFACLSWPSVQKNKNSVAEANCLCVRQYEHVLSFRCFGFRFRVFSTRKVSQQTQRIKNLDIGTRELSSHYMHSVHLPYGACCAVCSFAGAPIFRNQYYIVQEVLIYLPTSLLCLWWQRICRLLQRCNSCTILLCSFCFRSRDPSLVQQTFLYNIV